MGDKDMQSCTLLIEMTVDSFFSSRQEGFIIERKVYVKSAPYIYQDKDGNGILCRSKAEFAGYLENWNRRKRIQQADPASYENVLATSILDRHGIAYEKIVVDGEYYFSPSLLLFMAYKSNKDLIQFEFAGKRGYACMATGKIVVEPVWDWCAPFYGDFAMVRVGCPGTPGAREPKWPGYYSEESGHVFVSKGLCEIGFSASAKSFSSDKNYYWEWTMDSRCGYIDRTGKMVVPLNYIDGNENASDGLFVVRKPNALFGVVDRDERVLIDFDWFAIDRCCGFGFDGFVTFISQRGKNGDYSNIYSVPMKDDGKRSHDELDSYLMSLFSKEGCLIVSDLDQHPLNAEYTFESYMHHQYPDKEKADGAHYHKTKAIDSLGFGATDRYLIIRRNGKFGAIADKKLIQEPSLTWHELWSLLVKDWTSICQLKNGVDEDYDC